MSEPPAKRSRYSGSFSPSSPPYHHAKPPGDQTKALPGHPPNTPTSPPYMSPTHNNPHVSSSATNSLGHGSDGTPPSAAAMSTQSAQHHTHTSSNTMPTPASSTAGGGPCYRKDQDGDAFMTDEDGQAVPTAAKDVTMTGGTLDGIDLFAVSDHRAAMERLNRSMTPLYKLCENPHPMSRPHPSQNLISLYGLDDVASSVARKDPKTGEKINRLRKSYENKVKELRIAGKNKATSTPGALLGIVDWPEEEWMNQKVFGKEVERGLQPSVLAKLDKAVQMAPGRLPDSEQAKWRAVVGTDDSSKAKATSGQQATAQNANKKLGKPAATASNRPSAAPSPAPAKALRPERTGTKRRYDESSFKGYGEGYADDDPLGESTGAEDEPRGAGGAKKKRKTKDYPAGSPLGINAGSSGYNPGIVSIRR